MNLSFLKNIQREHFNEIATELMNHYFDELLSRIRDIRASEKRFYQKIRDLFALSGDYDATDKATQMFFA